MRHQENQGTAVDAEGRPIFTRQARPLDIPPALKRLAAEAYVVELDKLPPLECGTSVTKAGALIAHTQEIINRQTQGFYTLGEAAQLLADAQNFNAHAVFSDLNNAVQGGLLQLRGTDTKAPRPKANDFVSKWLNVVHIDDIDELLNRWRVAYRFPSDSAKTVAVQKPVQRQKAYEEFILAKLKELNFEPLSLPPCAAGKACEAKQAVKAALALSEAFNSVESFRKAWQRLSGERRIMRR
jgi:hypothetical protein